MSDLGFWTKTSKIDAGFLGTALDLAAIKSRSVKKQKKLTFIGILTISGTDAYSNGLASDKVGQKIQSAIDRINTFQAIVKIRKIVSNDDKELTQTLKDWSENLGLDLIFTIGDCGIATSAITPDVTRRVIEKEVPGMTLAMTMADLKLNSSSVLFRGVCGVRKSSLVINLPANIERAGNYLSALLPHLPTAIANLKAQSDFEELPAVALPTQSASTTTRSDAPSSLSAPRSHHQIPLSSSSQHHRLPLSSSHQQQHHMASNPSQQHALSSVPISQHYIASTTTSQHHLANTPTHHHLANTPTHHHLSNITTHVVNTVIRDEADSKRFPLHHQSERIHAGTSGLSRSASADLSEEGGGELTEEDILGGDTFDGVIAKESLRMIGAPPERLDVSSADSAFTGDASSDRGFSKVSQRPRSSPYPEVSVDKAYANIFAVTNPMPAVDMPYRKALNHVLVDDVVSACGSPRSDTVISDGYAVIAADLPGDLEVLTSFKSGPVRSGTVMRVTTGAAVPLGADAVVPVEETVLLSETDDGQDEASVRFLKGATPGQHIQPKGTNMEAGEVLLKAGTKLGHLQVALLASIGAKIARVYKYPVVAVLAYGKNLRNPDDDDVADEEVRDTNRLTFLLALERQGYTVVDMGIVNGDPRALQDSLKLACEKADVIITTGGTALGENDVVKPVLVGMGALLHFGRVAVKPGAPTAFATLDTLSGRKMFFILAGVPVPSYVGFTLFVLPCLRRLHGCKDPRSALVKARISSDVVLGTNPEYQRATLRYEEGGLVPWADVTGRQHISRTVSLSSADALLSLPTKTVDRQVLGRGDVVEVLLLD